MTELRKDENGTTRSRGPGPRNGRVKKTPSELGLLKWFGSYEVFKTKNKDKIRKQKEEKKERVERKRVLISFGHKLIIYTKRIELVT